MLHFVLIPDKFSRVLKHLSAVQARLLKVLAAHADNPLSYRDLARRVAVSSTNTVSYHLQELERKGYLKRDPIDPRSYQVVGQPTTGVGSIGLYGLARCGPKGSFLDDAPIDRIAFATRLIPFSCAEAFLVKAEGNSMEPRIHAGDLVLAKKSPRAEHGEIIVCVNEGMALIKKFVKKRHEALLVSLNPDYDPLIAADDFRVVGIVKNILLGAVSPG